MKVIEIEADEQQVRDLLDECYGDIKVGSLTFSASDIVESCDPTAFRCMVADEPIKYQCGECKEIYEDEEEAEDCCK